VSPDIYDAHQIGHNDPHAMNMVGTKISDTPKQMHKMHPSVSKEAFPRPGKMTVKQQASVHEPGARNREETHSWR
jgi:hypothetical protein